VFPPNLNFEQREAPTAVHIHLFYSQHCPHVGKNRSSLIRLIKAVKLFYEVYLPIIVGKFNLEYKKIECVCLWPGYHSNAFSSINM
jgi:hypothetical protein